jgi:outer membrane protein TolC
MAIRQLIIRTTLALLVANIYTVAGAQQQNTSPPGEPVPMAQNMTQKSLRESAQKAVLNSPEVLARWHAFRAAAEEVGVVKGGVPAAR